MRVPRPASLLPLLLAVLLLATPPGRLAGADSQQQFKQDAVPPDVQVTSPASEDYYDSDYEDDPSEVSTARPPTPDKGSPLLLPEVTFACLGRSEGYYADVQLRCEVFHYCKPDGVRFSFVCPPKSSFNQKLLICDYDPAAVSLCADSDLFFHLNDAPASQRLFDSRQRNVTVDGGTREYDAEAPTSQACHQTRHCPDAKNN
ncbi:hypothetical protein HPB47_003545 [Ixodes persulcatus]|uniref:Uncharacterized protein n=1 Tax=Ixodes persulcatus TaxID=34615 RepID=A0AC60PI52_IXOPE|nr:hypothetical protein HPB47_003545 [Ixodes persulcatus]